MICGTASVAMETSRLCCHNRKCNWSGAKWNYGTDPREQVLRWQPFPARGAVCERLLQNPTTIFSGDKSISLFSQRLQKAQHAKGTQIYIKLTDVSQKRPQQRVYLHRFWNNVTTHAGISTQINTIWNNAGISSWVEGRTTRTHPHAINAHTNQIHDNIKLNATYKDNMCINILDLSVTRKQTNLDLTSTCSANQPPLTQQSISFQIASLNTKWQLSDITSPEKKQRMGINTNNGQKQQLCTKSSTETKPANTTQKV